MVISRIQGQAEETSGEWQPGTSKVPRTFTTMRVQETPDSSASIDIKLLLQLCSLDNRLT